LNDASHPLIIMYTQAFCGYCAAARSLLNKKKAAYEEVDVTLNKTLRREMKDRSGKNTVPQIFIGDQYIGGYDDLSELNRDGKLDDLLQLSN
jgi:glutaredoxin 3